jgi:hypothetical protein
MASECPKCRGEMTEGFMLDRTVGGMDVDLERAEWVQGPPLKSFWTGLNVRGTEKLPIAALRCATCGFLELYARPQ